jgi:hypothetical protein
MQLRKLRHGTHHQVQHLTLSETKAGNDLNMDAARVGILVMPCGFWRNAFLHDAILGSKKSWSDREIE